MQSLPSVVLELSEVAGGKTMRIDKDNYYLNIAKAVAARSTCLRRQYGAVIVADDEIIATAITARPEARPTAATSESATAESIPLLSTSTRLATGTSTGPALPFTPSRMRLSVRRGGQCEVLPFTLHASMKPLTLLRVISATA